MSVTGVLPILAHLDKLSNKKLLGRSIAESSISRQWVQFKTCLLESADKKEALNLRGQLNMCLVNSVYLSGSEITAADIVMFHAIHDTVKGFSFQEKDQFVNLSQWFHNLQEGKVENARQFRAIHGADKKLSNFFCCYVRIL